MEGDGWANYVPFCFFRTYGGLVCEIGMDGWTRHPPAVAARAWLNLCGSHEGQVTGCDASTLGRVIYAELRGVHLLSEPHARLEFKY